MPSDDSTERKKINDSTVQGLVEKKFFRLAIVYSLRLRHQRCKEVERVNGLLIDLVWALERAPIVCPTRINLPSLGLENASCFPFLTQKRLRDCDSS